MLAGERKCVKPEGFDLGNSPREFAGDRLGDTLVIDDHQRHARDRDRGRARRDGGDRQPANLTSCAAAVARMARKQSGDVLIQCAGVKGGFTMDDAYTAGRFVQELAVWLPEWERSDAARAAEAISRSFETGGEGLAPRRAPATCARPTSTTTSGSARTRASWRSCRRWPTLTPVWP